MPEFSTFDVVVVGGGPGGIAAACAASEDGASVVLLESSPWLGGQVWSGGEHAHQSPMAKSWLKKIARSKVEVRTDSSVIGIDGQRVLVDGKIGSCEIQFKNLVLATGARELMVPFPGWTTPGVFGVGGLHNLAKLGWPVKGKRVAVAGSGPLLFSVAAHLRQLGAKVVLIAEQTDRSAMMRFAMKLPLIAPAKLAQGALYQSKLQGVPYKNHCWPTRVLGERNRVEGVTFSNGSNDWEIKCDYLACAFGFMPNLELPHLVGLEIHDGTVHTNDLLETSVPGIYCAGETTGIGGVDAALVEGQLAGLAAAGSTKKAERWSAKVKKGQNFGRMLQDTFALRDELKQLARPDTMLCRCEDVTVGQASAETDWRAAKLYHHMGMGSCQGRTCGAAVRFLFGWEPESVRPPVFPVKLGRLAEFGAE